MASKRTMLGLPALSADDEDDDVFGLGSSGSSRSTQFGLPAQTRDPQQPSAAKSPTPSPFAGDSEPDWDEDEDDYDATSIVPMSQLNQQMEFDGDFNSVDDANDAAPSVSEDELRATTAGRPITGSSPPNVASAWGLDESSDSTSVARGDVAPASASGGFAQYKPPRDDGHEVGTLLGMSLDELKQKKERDEEAQRGSRSTQFALPAVQSEPDNVDSEPEARTAVADADAISAITGRFENISDDGLDEESEDSPTQAWNPSESPEFDEILRKQAESKNKSKLELLREKKHLLKKPGRDTAKGIPSIPKSSPTGASSGRPADPRKQVPRRAPDPTPQARDDQRTSSISSQQLSSLANKASTEETDVHEAPAMQNRGLETPASGVLKVPKRTNPPGSLRAEDVGLAGTGSYSKLKSRGETTSDAPVVSNDQATHPATDGPVAGAVPTSARKPSTGLADEASRPSPTPRTDPPGKTAPHTVPPGDPTRDAPARPSGVGLHEDSWEEEYAYAETGIAPAEGLNISSNGRPASPTSSPAPPSVDPSEPPAPQERPQDPRPTPSAFAASSQPAPNPDNFQASNSQIRPFASSSTGPKFPVASSDASYPAQRNTLDGSLPSDPNFTPYSGSFAAQQQKKGLEGMSATDLFSDLPDSVNTKPPGMAPPPTGPRTGALAPGEGIENFDFSAPSRQPMQMQQMHQMADTSGSNLMNAPQGVGQQQADGLTTFVGRAQAVFGVLSGIALLVSLYFSLQPFAVPSEPKAALSLALVGVSGLGGLVLSLFPVSPGLRGVAFGILGLFALVAFGLVLTAASPNRIVLALVLAGVILAFVAALFPVIGKLVS